MRACSKKTFGAFHEGTWAGNGYDQNAKANFLFKLGDSLEKFPNKGSGDYAYKYSTYWPCFGDGCDLGWGNGGKLGAGSDAQCKAGSYSAVLAPAGIHKGVDIQGPRISGSQR